jgi:hypothetical protein
MIEEKPSDPAERQQSNAGKWPAAIIRIFRAFKRYNDEQKSRRKPQETAHQKNERLAAESSWLIGKLTVVIAAAAILGVLVSGFQWRAINGQLNEMQVENRPWVGLDTIQSDADIKSGQAFNILAFVKNFGHSPALHVSGCVASDTPNIHQRDEAGVAGLFKELDGCKPIQTYLMPDGEYGYDVSRDGNLMNDSVVADVKSGFATFAVFGKITYEDGSKNHYWTTFCALYVQNTGKFNACLTGNETK